MIPVSLGLASVLYTFYPPMVGNPFYYIGVVMVVVGSWIWVALMSINLAIWKRENPDKPVPLAMFANVAGSYLWGWTAVGAALEIIFQILPVALGLTATIDAGLARVFFSWTLHAIVYFWLIPTYIAYYTIFPRAIGGRLYSDAMARISFILFVVVAMPIGVHHLFTDPQVGPGFKFMHSVFTGLVALPTLLTVFTICASAEIASRLRGGTVRQLTGRRVDAGNAGRVQEVADTGPHGDGCGPVADAFDFDGTATMGVHEWFSSGGVRRPGRAGGRSAAGRPAMRRCGFRGRQHHGR
jgi:cytochrome c oxidase subunit 1